MDSIVLQELIMLTLKAFTSYRFKVSILLCDGASSNLTVMNILSGYPRTQFHSRPDAATLRERYFVEASFSNSEDPVDNPIFLMICPSHQVISAVCMYVDVIIYNPSINLCTTYTIIESLLIKKGRKEETV